MDSKTDIKASAFPACHVRFPQNMGRQAATFWLAAEEYVAEHLPEGNYFFTWQLSPTVVMGRNQVAHAEINLDYCHTHGIDVVRRKSGGGCIYADEGNLMLSLITPSRAVETLFAEYATTVAQALNQLGAAVITTGRNDICLADGRKICGNAFYHLPKRNIVHGTMLFDTQAVNMQNAITPDAATLSKAGVASVKSRIGLLKDVLSIDIHQLRTAIETSLCNEEVHLTHEDVKRIFENEKAYRNPEFLYGKSRNTHITHSDRIAGCGSVEIHFSLCGNTITEVRLTGDFFECGNAEEAFSKAFIGASYHAESMREIIDTLHPEESIRNFSTQALRKLLNIEQEGTNAFSKNENTNP